jgi:Zn-dependent protease with chaperone function
MRNVGRGVAKAVLFTLVLSLGATPAMASGPATDIVTSPGLVGAAEKDALAAAVALVPQAPVRIAVIDVTQNRPPVRDYLLTLDAFTVKGNAVIYVVQQSELLKGARAGSALSRAMLATVLWHEMAHLSGADEREARQAEEKLWMQFVRDGVTDQVTGLRYLQALRTRADDQGLASR